MQNKPQEFPLAVRDENPRLGVFIRENKKSIIEEWIRFARTIKPASDDMTQLALRDHIEGILMFLADDLESDQTSREQAMKSYGKAPKEDGAGHSAAEIHAGLRLTDGFDIEQMVSEYRVLRASVVKLWTEKHPDLIGADFRDLNRYNEAVDQALTESICHFTKQIDHSRDMFLGILGHDLRNPIGAAFMSAKLMIRLGGIDEKQTRLASQIVNSTARASQILTDLLDLARAGFGAELPVIKSHLDMGVTGKELVEEMRAYSGREIALEALGNLEGDWDKVRIGQIFSNLIGNAIQYSFRDTPVTVTLKGQPEEIILSVHNEGPPIPADKREKIFDSLTRATSEGQEQTGSGNLGLGLYITKKIIDSHGGTISVASSEKEGTTFTAILPRR